MRRAFALFVLGIALVSASCGGSDPASTPGSAAQVDWASCQISGRSGKQTPGSCTFVISDGRRFSCNRFFTGRATSVSQLVHASGCHHIASVVLSPAERVLSARLDRARSCLTAKGLRGLGGQVLPPPRFTSNEPDGELVISSSTSPTFIAFYTTAARASRIEPGLRRSDARMPVQLERRGSVTIAWAGRSTSEFRNMVWTCLPQ